METLWSHVEHESGETPDKRWALTMAEILMQRGQWSPDVGDVVIVGELEDLLTVVLAGEKLVEGVHYRVKAGISSPLNPPG